MKNNEWELLRNCADFQEVYDHAFNTYGVDEYCSVLDRIESELEFYENATEEEWQKEVETNNIPNSVQWYVGMIDTEYFINECCW